MDARRRVLDDRADQVLVELLGDEGCEGCDQTRQGRENLIQRLIRRFLVLSLIWSFFLLGGPEAVPAPADGAVMTSTNANWRMWMEI